MTKIDFSDLSLYVDRVQEFTQALYDPNIRYIFLKGGSGAGKSFLVAQQLIPNILEGVRVGIFRKVSNTLKASCLQLMKDVIRKFGIGKFIEVKENKDIRGGKGFAMMFGLDDPEKIKSLANFDRFWIEEATELTYDDFTQLDLRLRGGVNHKIICSFNPISNKHRLKTEVQDHPEKRQNAVRIEKTAWDNKFAGEQYLRMLNELKEKNEAKWKIYALNHWGEGLKGSIYPDFELFDYDIVPDYIGLDFGFNDPNALTYVKVEDKSETKDLYVQEKIYLSGQNSRELIEEMERLKVPKNVLILADGARPETISDIHKAGYLIEGVKKYAGSKKDQIDAVKTYRLHINGSNLLKEISGYVWKLDPNGNPIDVPMDGDDHLMDSMAYAVTQYRNHQSMKLYLV